MENKIETMFLLIENIYEETKKNVSNIEKSEFVTNYLIFNVLPYLDKYGEKIVVKEDRKSELKIKFGIDLNINNCEEIKNIVFDYISKVYKFKSEDIENKINKEFSDFIGKKFIPYDEYLMIKNFFGKKGINIKDKKIIEIYTKKGIFYRDLNKCQIFFDGKFKQNTENDLDNIIDEVNKIRFLFISKTELKNIFDKNYTKNKTHQELVDIIDKKISNIEEKYEQKISNLLNEHNTKLTGLDNNVNVIFDDLLSNKDMINIVNDFFKEIGFNINLDEVNNNLDGINNVLKIYIDINKSINESKINWKFISELDKLKFAYLCYYFDFFKKQEQNEISKKYRVNKEENINYKFDSEKFKDIIELCYMPILIKIKQRNELPFINSIKKIKTYQNNKDYFDKNTKTIEEFCKNLRNLYKNTNIEITKQNFNEIIKNVFENEELVFIENIINKEIFEGFNEYLIKVEDEKSLKNNINECQYRKDINNNIILNKEIDAKNINKNIKQYEDKINFLKKLLKTSKDLIETSENSIKISEDLLNSLKGDLKKVIDNDNLQKKIDKQEFDINEIGNLIEDKIFEFGIKISELGKYKNYNDNSQLLLYAKYNNDKIDYCLNCLKKLEKNFSKENIEKQKTKNKKKLEELKEINIESENCNIKEKFAVYKFLFNNKTTKTIKERYYQISQIETILINKVSYVIYMKNNGVDGYIVYKHLQELKSVFEGLDKKFNLGLYYKFERSINTAINDYEEEFKITNNIEYLTKLDVNKEFEKIFLDLLPRNSSYNYPSRQFKDEDRIYHVLYQCLCELTSGKREISINENRDKFVGNDIHHMDENTKGLDYSKLIALAKLSHQQGIHELGQNNIYIKNMFDIVEEQDYLINNIKDLKRDLKTKLGKLESKDKRLKLNIIRLKYMAIKLFSDHKILEDTKNQINKLNTNNIDSKLEEVYLNINKEFDKINVEKVASEDTSINNEKFKEVLSAVASCYIGFDKMSKKRIHQ